MIRSGTAMFLASLILFLLFLGHVALARLGVLAGVSDVTEVIVLFASVVFFVAGTLLREAHERHRRGADEMQNGRTNQ